MRLLWAVFVLLPVIAPCQSSFDFRGVDRVMNEAVSALTRGISLTVVVDGQQVYRRAVGSFESDRRVPIASATKWYSAAVVLALVDRGLLRLDDPASRLIPSFRGAKSSITLRQLLSHTSGLTGDVPCLYESGSTMLGCVEEIAAEPLLFTPGSRFSYGNAAMQVAGRMAELATGKTWRRLFDEHLVQPLEMTCTSMDAFHSADNPVVANGGLSCESDYLKFLGMVLARGQYRERRLLSEAAVNEMMRDQTGGVPIVESIYSNYAGLDQTLPLLRYGLGMWRERVSPQSGEAIELGSQGATGFSPWVDRERNLTAVLSTESSQDAIMATYLAVKNALRFAVVPWSQRTLLATNAASFRLGPVAPGEIVTIFGPGIGPSRAASARLEDASRFATELERTRVLFDGKPAPLLYASWSQISTVVPFTLEGSDRTVVQVERAGALGPRLTLPVARTAPGVFQHDGTRGVVLNQDGTLNSAGNPARPGSIIVFYATGGGQTDPASVDGHIQSVLSRVRARAEVTAGGKAAEVLYCGGPPGLIAGALQVNVRLAEDTPVGDAVPLVLTVADVSSAPVTIAVR
jgi:uncharacterized protein (TIGR03437 family)